MNNIVILDSEIKQAKMLSLEDVEGNLLKGNFLMIEASGLTNSLRKMRDGYCFFGPIERYVIIFYSNLIIEKLYHKRFCY